MIDALLYAARDGIRAAGFNYDQTSCEICADGHPPPRCGAFFVAVHGGRSRPGGANQRNLDELFGFSVTLTMRVTVALDRAGDQQVARNLPLKDIGGVPLALRQGFNARLEQLRAYLHSNWAMVVLVNRTPPSANDNLAAWAAGTVYGFVEPARWAGEEVPRLVGGEWFSAAPDAPDVGIVSEMRFDGARRVQPQTAAVGAFV